MTRTMNGRRPARSSSPAEPTVSAAGEDWRDYWGIPPAVPELSWPASDLCGAGPVRCRLFAGHDGRHDPAPVFDKFPAQRARRRRK